MVRTAGLKLPNVEAAIKYDGSPVLKVDGVFMAGLAMDRSAEPDTLVVRCSIEDREGLLEDAPETYYLTDYYQKHPVVLVRLRSVDSDVLRELLKRSWHLTTGKIPQRRRKTGRSGHHGAGL
jgi:hypothetical protein